MNRGQSTSRRRAFTVVELLVVIGIIVLIVAIAVPSFASMSASTQRSFAENGMRSALRVARDLAIQSAGGGDAAAVFLYDARAGVTIVPAVHIASIIDFEGEVGSTGGSGGASASSTSTGRYRREVFIPAPGVEPIRLPRPWAVRGYAPPGSMRDASIPGTVAATWYDGPLYGGNNLIHDAKSEGNWLFPESGFYATDEQERLFSRASTARQSFMVRFEAGTGRLRLGDATAVFVDPRPGQNRDRDIPNSSKPNYADPHNNFWKRVDQAVSVERWAVRVANDPDPDGNGQPYGGKNAFMGDGDLLERSRIIGSRSNDTVLIRGVSRLALYSIKELAQGIGARGLNENTRSLYLPYDKDAANPEIEIDTALFGSTTPDTDDIRLSINHWIVGDTDRDSATDWPVGDGVFSFDPDVDDPPLDEPKAALFVISPYTGQIEEFER